jgi:diadenosine tetraphosphate (Ap4A) HIT family hydrolase
MANYHKVFEKKFLKTKSQHPDKHPDCKFCNLVKDKKNIIYENPHIIVVFGRPHHKGHLVVLTRAHEEHIMKLHEKSLDSLFNDTMKVCKALHKAIKFDRLNLEYLNNWDPHIHWNIYPRFKTDKDWGNPPKIPKKNGKFKPKNLSKKELAVFKKQLSKI